ncbi:unnamed protein product [marine sediment metagenome]|uniref:Uncharacterized protein n=1 Tax=marine sediment metagenome TaxID=412755 RepID=X1SQF0_9ZZZZ
MNDEELHDFIYGIRPDIELKLALILLPISRKDKKHAWQAYCKSAGVKLTRTDVLEITGGFPL